LSKLTVRPGQPKTVDELLWRCRLLIADGDLEAARRLATRFAEDAADTRVLDPTQRFERLAYAWYILCLAAYTVCQTKREDEVHDFLVMFFRAHKTASWFFLKYLQSFDHGLRGRVRQLTEREELMELYDAIYRTWGAGVAGRADLAANREVSL